MAEAFLTRTGVPRRRLVMVGDAPVDLQCARRAGCISVAALWGFGSTALLLQEHPHHAAASPSDLQAWLTSGAWEAVS
jgi:phosphoglycolate phosphatase-like HAD superfamily hydrolase